MITYIPEIYPDELIYSWFSRIYVNSGILSSKTAMKTIFQKDSDTANIEFVGNISTDFREQIGKMYDWKWLILNHTMFSQYARFISLDKKMGSLNILSERHENPRILLPILPKTKDEAYLKYCPLCVKEDRNKYGESYWHRVHQLRSIDICVKHKCFLHKAQISSKKLISYSFQAAEQYTNDDKVVPVTDKTHVNYAEYAQNIFESALNLEKNISLPVLFYKKMKTTKYMKRTGTSRYTDLFVTDMQQFYKKMGINHSTCLQYRCNTNHFQKRILQCHRHQPDHLY